MRVALYLRRSTSELQPDSLVAQRERLTAWSAEHGHVIVATFEDSASGRFVDGRDGFLEMIEVVKNGAPFEAILVRDVARWSRAENIDLAGYYEFICRSHGVAVIYVDEPFAPDQSPYSLLVKNLKRAMAAEFSMERSRMVHATQVRVVQMGFWPVGGAPFGMKRVLVDAASGNPIRDLAPGEAKTLSTQRVKFAPGDPAKVATVREIFQFYLQTGASVRTVALDLNRAGVRSPRGGIWTTSQVNYILHNEVYVGTLAYHIWRDGRRSALNSRKDSPKEETIRFENAHEAIISKDVWAAVQKKIKEASWRRTDRDLVEELRRAMERWQIPMKSFDIAAGDQLRKGFGAPDAAIIGERFAAAKARIRRRLAAHFQVDDVGEGLLLDHLLFVGFECSLTHAGFGPLHFRFNFANDREYNVVLGIAFSPPPRIAHVETFLFRMSYSRKPRLAVRPPVDESQAKIRFPRFRPEASLDETLDRCFGHRDQWAEKEFIEAVRKHDVLNLDSVAEALGWSIAMTRSMYRRLEIRGDALPRLRSSSRRIAVTCPHCRRTRVLSPQTVLALKTDVCFECLHRPVAQTPNTHVDTCPLCGARRLLSPSEVENRTDGETLCAACNRKVAALRRDGGTPSV